MTAADIPRTLGQPDQGFEGNRFTGIPMYDSLTQWDLSKADAASVLIPALATSWAVDAKDKTKWIFKLRPDVKFHDGSRLQRRRRGLERAQGAGQGRGALRRQPGGRDRLAHADAAQSARKIDDLTVELTTSEPDAFLPLNLTNLFMASPAHWQKKFDAAPGATPADKSKAAWIAFAADASGTRPVQDGALRAARAAGDGGQQDLLGPEAHAQDRPRGAAADARGQRAHRGAAVRPGRLDRGAVARRDGHDPGARQQDLLQPAAARVALAAVLCRRLALARQARAPRRQPVRRPRWA